MRTHARRNMCHVSYGGTKPSLQIFVPLVTQLPADPPPNPHPPPTAAKTDDIRRIHHHGINDKDKDNAVEANNGACFKTTGGGGGEAWCQKNKKAPGRKTSNQRSVEYLCTFLLLSPVLERLLLLSVGLPLRVRPSPLRLLRLPALQGLGLSLLSLYLRTVRWLVQRSTVGSKKRGGL